MRFLFEQNIVFDELKVKLDIDFYFRKYVPKENN